MNGIKSVFAPSLKQDTAYKIGKGVFDGTFWRRESGVGRRAVGRHRR